MGQEIAKIMSINKLKCIQQLRIIRNGKLLNPFKTAKEENIKEREFWEIRVNGLGGSSKYEEMQVSQH